ncbi:hypothetical protein oki388_14680 [Helicobacter pylori]
MALTAFKTILRAIDENFKQNSNHNKEKQRHAEKIKNIEQLVASGILKILSKEYFMGFQNENQLKVGASVKATINGKVVEA